MLQNISLKRSTNYSFINTWRTYKSVRKYGRTENMLHQIRLLFSMVYLMVSFLSNLFFVKI